MNCKHCGFSDFLKVTDGYVCNRCENFTHEIQLNALPGISGGSPEQAKNADERQAGGDHYKKLKVQPWDAMEAWLTPEEFRGFLKGNIIKYIARANSGKEDHNLMIEKAAHYQQKLDEMIVKWKSS